MITIKEINVTDMFGADFLYITFKVKDTTEDLSLYTFNLWKSDSKTTPFYLLATDVKEFAFQDYDINKYTIAIPHYYKVEAVNSATGEKKLLDIIGEYKGREIDDLSAGIVYNYNVYLENVVKNEAHLLRRKHGGQYCPHCYDPIRTRAADARCPVCYGTKWVGGFYIPQKIKINLLTPLVRAEEFTISEQADKPQSLEVWTGNFPVIHINDILVDTNGVRYIVTNMRQTHKNYFLLRQDFQLQYMTETDIIYSIPLNKS